MQTFQFDLLIVWLKAPVLLREVILMYSCIGYPESLQLWQL